MKTITVSFLITIIMISACSSNTNLNVPHLSQLLKEESGQNGRSCIRTSNIRGYAVNSDILTIEAGRQYYLATTLYRCHELDFAAKAAFSSRFHQICGSSNAYVITSSGRCPIHQIFEFDDKTAAFAMLDKIEEKQQAMKEAANKTP